MQPTARQFGNAVKKCLVEHPFGAIATVKSKTTSFSGFGYGSGIFAEITTTHSIPDSTKDYLKKVQAEFEAQADEGNHFIISLAGSPYPFGGSIKS
jgi:hypothetical protein